MHTGERRCDYLAISCMEKGVLEVGPQAQSLELVIRVLERQRQTDMSVGLTSGPVHPTWKGPSQYDTLSRKPDGYIISKQQNQCKHKPEFTSKHKYTHICTFTHMHMSLACIAMLPDKTFLGSIREHPRTVPHSPGIPATPLILRLLIAQSSIPSALRAPTAPQLLLLREFKMINLLLRRHTCSQVDFL